MARHLQRGGNVSRTLQRRIDKLEQLAGDRVASMADATKALTMFEQGKITQAELDAQEWEPSLFAGMTCERLAIRCGFEQPGQRCSCSVDCPGYKRRSK